MYGIKLEEAIHFVKKTFEEILLEKLSLTKVVAPAFVSSSSGIQDELNGIERAVCFSAKNIKDEDYEIIHSLAKWKRAALARYNVQIGRGICADMRAIRPDEDDLTSDIHSIYVDQWDWEKVISEEDRTLDMLYDTVLTIFDSIKLASRHVETQYGLSEFFPEKIFFVHADELTKLWPNCSPQEREYKIAKDKRAVFIVGIGGELSDGNKHDGRAPDYDDWMTQTSLGKGLNGDIIVWNPVLKREFELSSMGIRVNKKVLLEQLQIANALHRAQYPWHQSLIEQKLPQTIGGGIGQSRLVMLLLQRKHIGEVHVGVWPQTVINDCLSRNIDLRS